MTKTNESKLNPKWIIKTRDYFLDFLKVTKFPAPERYGIRGSKFEYPEWLIMFIAILAVKCKVKTYLGIHRLVKEQWATITKGHKFKKIISEANLRDRLKKIRFKFGKTPTFVSQIFPPDYLM